MKKSFLAVVFMLGFFISSTTFAAAPYYDGKTIRIIVGASAGGGWDTYARLISRYFGKHIPGKPTVIVENMIGAASLACVNYVSKIAKPDGLTIGVFNGGLFFSEAMGQPGIEFDARKLVYLGAPIRDDSVTAFSKKSGITSMEKLMSAKTPVKMGGVGRGANVDNNIRVLKEALGLPIQLIAPYGGTADIRLAVESGELAGASWQWSSMRATWRKALQSGDVVVVLQGVPKPLPDLPKVPLAISYAKTDEARQLIEVGIHNSGIFSRPYVLPPATPKEQAQILTKAFADTLKDKELLAEAKKMRLDFEPVSAPDLEQAVASIRKLDPVMMAKLKDILYK
ncbi:MAG: hypothetical protein Q8P24_20450 [Desulfobacterales bacterium]|nr:hypothetical protein [Desulfobacterales bacterium]